MAEPIYLDNNATTRVDPSVVEALVPYLSEQYGNSSSTSHSFGQAAEQAIDAARAAVAGLLNCKPQEIVFTSGATESNNLAILGTMRSAPIGSKLIIAAAEHKAVLDPAAQLASEGYKVCVLPVDRYGCVSADEVACELDSSTRLVSIMHGNNEIGSLNPIEEIGRVCRDRNITFHSDATQTVGKIPLDLSGVAVDMLSLSAHKMYGPKGVGALFVRKKSPRQVIRPMIFGGGHEKKLRSGTLPVHQIVGLGKACEICSKELAVERSRVSKLRELFKESLAERIPDICFNGHPDNRLPGSVHVSIPGANAEAVMMKLRSQLAMSSGSACTMSSLEPSHVLMAIGLDSACLTTSLRFGIGRFNTEPEIRNAADLVSSAANACRQLSGYPKNLKI